MDQLENLIDVLGWLWATAIVCEFLAVLAESWGSSKPKDEDEPRQRDFGDFAASVAAVVSPGLLLAHGFIVTAPMGGLVLYAVGAVFAAVIGGSLLGWLFGAMARPAANSMHMVAKPLGFGVLILSVVVAWPSMPLIVPTLLALFARFLG